MSANCISLSIVYTGDFIYIKQLDKEYFCLVRSIRTHQDSAESRFVSKTHSKTEIDASYWMDWGMVCRLIV